MPCSGTSVSRAARSISISSSFRSTPIIFGLNCSTVFPCFEDGLLETPRKITMILVQSKGSYGLYRLGGGLVGSPWRKAFIGFFLCLLTRLLSSRALSSNLFLYVSLSSPHIGETGKKEERGGGGRRKFDSRQR